jgi:hypothetical protein
MHSIHMHDVTNVRYTIDHPTQKSSTLVIESGGRLVEITLYDLPESVRTRLRLAFNGAEVTIPEKKLPGTAGMDWADQHGRKPFVG